LAGHDFQQVERLAGHGVDVADHERAAGLLKAIGYYRLTGYLYPFRESEQYIDDEDRTRTRVLSGYRSRTRSSSRRLIPTLDHGIGPRPSGRHAEFTPPHAGGVNPNPLVYQPRSARR